MGTNMDDFIRERITSLRMKKNVSEMQMSREIGKSPTYLSAVMSNKGLPSLHTLIDICDYFNISLVDFFSGEVSNPIVLNEGARALGNCSEDALQALLPLIKMAQKRGTPK